MQTGGWVNGMGREMDGEIGEGITGWSCSVGILRVPLPAVLPARIIPAEHMATDVICLHESRLLRTVKVCRMGHGGAGAAGPLWSPHPSPCPSHFPKRLLHPFPEPAAPFSSADCPLALSFQGVLLNGITMCRGRAGVPGRATCWRRRFKAKPDPSRDTGRRGRPRMFPGSVSSCNLVK